MGNSSSSRSEGAAQGNNAQLRQSKSLSENFAKEDESFEVRAAPMTAHEREPTRRKVSLPQLPLRLQRDISVDP